MSECNEGVSTAETLAVGGECIVRRWRATHAPQVVAWLNEENGRTMNYLGL